MRQPPVVNASVAIRNGADPRLRRNKIHDGKQYGVRVSGNGLGTLEDNDITGNDRGAWSMADDLEVTVTRARNKE